MSAFKKILLIMWKNWLFRKRQIFMTSFELIIPTFLTYLLVVLKTKGGEDFLLKLNNASFYPKKEIPEHRFNLKGPSLSVCFTNSRASIKNDGDEITIPNIDSDQNITKVWRTKLVLYYTPKNEFTTATMECLKTYYFHLTGRSLQIQNVTNEKEIEIIAQEENVNYYWNFWGGISFLNDFEDTQTVPENLHYRIRISYKKWNNWNTRFLMPAMTRIGPGFHEIAYQQTRFVLIQHLIAMFYIQRSTQADVSSLHVTAQKFPYPEYFSDNAFNLVMGNLLSLFLCLSYVFIAPTLIKRIVCEKEHGIKELMKIMGLHGWIQWIGWFFTSFIVMSISAIIIVILLFVPFSPNMSVFNRSDPILFFIFLLLYISCSITFCFFISSFFSKPSLATGIGALIWILTFAVPNYTLVGKFDTMSSHEKLVLCLLPNMAMTFCLRIAANLESRNMGLRWEYILSPGTVDDNINALQVMGMMVLNVIFYSFLTFYMDNVFPGIYGTKKLWYFLFMKSYWCGHESRPIENAIKNENKENIENDPVGLTPTVIIKNLVKEYIKGHRAVDNISLNIYEGQITALLGHNGAGKTTTMSILTGMIAPSSGTVYIEGIDITKDIDKIRNSISLCPQYNMLFDILTVKEHLMFFGKLKNISGIKLQQEINTLLIKLQLESKSKTLSMKLSGGMKRKLHLGMALIGGNKVVMLDEPTSGMDPEARRAIWDVLQEIRKEKTILLSTHFMEEADVLSDRIAIMAHGKIYCCGTTMFLKKRFGAGYHLNISITDDCNVLQLSQLIQNHLSRAYIDHHINNEVSYVLPAENTRDFPELFENLENQMKELCVNNFGISVTTMEEVFLKAGDSANENPKDLPNSDSVLSMNDGETLLINDKTQRSVLRFNTDFTLKIQQFFGLLLKRWHYSRRRWILIVGQIIVPAITVIIILLINNSMSAGDPIEPSRVMDLSQYGNTITLVNEEDTSLFKLSSFYGQVLPPTSKVQNVENVTEELFKMATENIAKFNNEYIIAAEITSTDINVLYNGVYFHTLPLTLNVLHNALLRSFSKSSRNSKIVVENAPLPKRLEDVEATEKLMKLIKSVMIGIYIPIGMSVLAASFVIFPIHERITKAKHIQLMTGVGGFLFWIASFIWDFLLHTSSSILMLLFFAVLDKSKLLSGDGQLGVIFLVLILYGWCAIPFSYIVSFISNIPATGFNRLTIVNLIAGLTFSLMVFFFKFTGSADLKTAGDILQWFTRLIPIYPVTICFMTISQASIQNNICRISDLENRCKLAERLNISMEITKCCPNICGNNCFEIVNYLQWESPGIGQEVMMMILDGMLYFVIIILIERGVMYKIWYSIKSLKKKHSNKIAPQIISSPNLDSDVLKEKDKINATVRLGKLSLTDSLLVHNLTKHFSDFAAVEDLNFGVKQSECFGLLGVNGAGKTTTFRMLTGDEIITNGNAYLDDSNIKEYPSQFLRRITYCPQFDALIDHMTTEEHLWLFARLRGIYESEIRSEVEKFIDIFDLTQHRRKNTMVLSGGNKRKLSTAIAFLGNPHIVLLDEPTTGVDPIARRKLWNILLSAKVDGVSIILTSHSMEECEVLCSRLAIMVNGQFQCIGGIQHLKNKFGQGFTIIAKLKTDVEKTDSTKQSDLQYFIVQRFPNCILKDIHQGIVHYQIIDSSVSWRYLFQTMEEAKEMFNLEDYSVSQATLEQIFLAFAKKQRINEDPKNGKKG